MNAEVVTGFFTHQHNHEAVIRQEYEAAEEHFREVCLHRVPGNADHDQRFRDAVDRRDAARERFVELLAR